MIISDLEHLEVVAVETHLLGGIGVAEIAQVRCLLLPGLVQETLLTSTLDPTESFAMSALFAPRSGSGIVSSSAGVVSFSSEQESKRAI